MSNSRRQEMRKKREAAEAELARKEKKEKTKKLAIIVGFFALALVVTGVFIFANVIVADSDKSSGGDDTNVEQLLQGIPQNGTTLGNPNAPVTVVEFADLRCPFCADFSKGGLKDLIAGPVRDGEVKLEFRHWSIIPGSSDVAYGMYAAAEQDRAWQFIENFYNDQGAESGTVSFDQIKEVAEKSGVPDMAKWERDYNSAEWDQKMLDVDSEASSLGFNGTPSVAIEGPNGKLVATDLAFDSTLAEIQQAISKARSN